jgi:hypothetical protein
MLSYHKQLLRQNEDLYEVVDSFPSTYFLDESDNHDESLFTSHRESIDHDIILKNDSRIFFCKKIEEIEFEMVNHEQLLQIQ